MKFAIAVDLEGIGGVLGYPNERMGRDSQQVIFAAKQAVKEVNAAVESLYEVGAKQVYVWDNHNGSLNLDYHQLDKRVDIIAGVGAKHRWPGLDGSIDGILLMGYHAKADTYGGILAHTFSSDTYQYIKINGKTVGEMEVDAACAGKLLKAPVIFVSSDEQGVLQAKESFPWVKTVSTKKPLGRNLAILKHPDRVVDEIRETVKTAVDDLDQKPLYAFDEPLDMEIRFMRLEEAEKWAKDKVRKMNLIDPYTVGFKVKDILELY